MASEKGKTPQLPTTAIGPVSLRPDLARIVARILRLSPNETVCLCLPYDPEQQQASHSLISTCEHCGNKVLQRKDREAGAKNICIVCLNFAIKSALDEVAQSAKRNDDAS